MEDNIKSISASAGAIGLTIALVSTLETWLISNQHAPSRFTLILFSTLFFQTILIRYAPFLFKKDIYSYSESLAKYEIVELMVSKFGQLTTAVMIYLSNYLLGFGLLTFLILTGLVEFGFLSFTLLGLAFAFMLDPIIAFILKSHKTVSNIAADTVPVIMGYIAILLIGIGAIPVDSIASGRTAYILAFCWMSARMAFIINFAFDRKQDILVFAPSIGALFIAVAPNLVLITNQL